MPNYNVYDFISNVEYPITLFLSLFVFCIYLNKRKFWYLTGLGGFIIIEILWCFAKIPSPVSFFSYIIIFLLTIGMLMLALKYSFFQTLFITTCAFCVQHLTYKLNVSFIFLIGFTYWHSWWYFLSYLFFIAIIDIIIYFLFARYFKKDTEIRVNSLLVLFIGLAVVFLTIILSYYTQERLATETMRYTFVEVNLYAIFLCIAALIILFSNTKNLRLKEENKAMEVLLKKDEERYELAKISAEKINLKYHDLKHQLLNPNLTKEEKDEILKEGKLQSSIYFTNCKALDTVLMEKSLLCQNKKIQMTAICDGALLSFIKSYQIYSLFGNLIDNAIEALDNIQDQNKRTIKVDVRRVKDNVLIEVENYTNHSVTFKDGLPLTTKKDKENHGFGMKSIKNIVDSYNGYLKCEVINDLFKVKIVFPISKN